jgi:hypothetical protein
MEGKLIRVENLKMCDCLTKWFFNLQNLPDYTIVNDKYLYTQEEGDILKKQYNLKIKRKRNAQTDRSSKRGHCKSQENKKQRQSKNFLTSFFYIVL